jgi:hypothetical protein
MNKAMYHFFKWLASVFSEDKPLKRENLKEGLILWNARHKNRVKVHKDLSGLWFVSYGKNNSHFVVVLNDELFEDLQRYKKQDLQILPNESTSLERDK